MEQAARLKYLLSYLLTERGEEYTLPKSIDIQKQLLRALVNIRPPKAIHNEFLEIQNAYLKEEIKQKGITKLEYLQPIQEDIYLWKGDITTLKCEAIINAANSQMLGCFCPNHRCIDNAIHTFAGVQLRQECAKIMQKQGEQEGIGRAKLTKAYNLPSQYILHTVGPMVHGRLTEQDKIQLKNCYQSCLQLADKSKIQSLAFCCISTGEFHFPNDIAANIAIQTVLAYKRQMKSKIKLIFNVFKEYDYAIYAKILKGNR